MRLRIATPLVLLTTVTQLSRAQGPPVVDHHQHLFSPDIAALIKLPEISAAELIARLDSAGIQRAVVLSMAYQHGSPSRTMEDEYAKVRAENDWTAAQVAHLAGSGGGEDPPADSALAFLARAMHEHAPGTRNLWFDVTAVANDTGSPARARQLVGWMREIGMDRLLFGSDATAGGNLSPKHAWAAFCRLPLTTRELSLVAENVAPYLH